MNIELEHINYYKPEIILWEKISSDSLGATQGISTPVACARILRVYGNQAEIHIPDLIEGCPVTEIGPYCFSASSPKIDKARGTVSLPKIFRTGEIEECGSEADASYEFLPGSRLPEELQGFPAICGKFIKAVYLPETVETLHNAAFYNCRFLHTLSVGPAISGIGSDEFTNCTRLVNLVLRCPDNHASGIALILERITTDLDIYYMKDDSEDSPIDGVVFFPEYYEWLDEVTPAHIFSRSINGEGFRMRKAFQNGMINYAKYDACLDNATKTENPSVLWHLAFWRLSFPNGLEDSPALQEKYLNVLKGHLLVGVKHFVKERKLWGLTALCELTNPDSEQLLAATSLATEAEWGEGIAYLMERNRPATSFADKTFDFDWEI